MRRSCAWCGETLDSGEHAGGEQVSHGICPHCLHRLESELGVPLAQFLEGLDAPVYLVDVETGGRVKGANVQGLELVESDAEAARGRLLGDVFQCANAELPGGCGRTVHCSGCVIRRAVEHTWSTGEARRAVPATVRPGSPDSPLPAELLISTERAGDRVILHVRPAPST